MISLTKKLLSVALAVVLLLGAFPATVSAATGDNWTVTVYDADGSTVLGTIEAVEGGAPIAVPASMEKKVTVPADSELTGWVRKNGQPINPVIDNFNIIPVFTKIQKVTLSFNTNCEVPNPSSVTVKKGDTVALPKLTREGYTLTGWNGNAPGSSYQVNADATLTAEWSRNEYTVTFLKADGSVLHTETVRHDEKIAHVPQLSEAGAKDGKVAYDWDAKVDGKVKSNMTIKPLFRSVDYTITFNPNHGTCETKHKNVTYGEKIGKMPVPERQDFVFQGWYRDGMEYTKNTVYNVASDIELTAKWVPEAKVELHIYRNGKTSSAYLEPMIPDVPAGSILKMSDIDVGDYYNGSNSFKVVGIFDAMGWRAYKAGENAKPIEQVQTIDPSDGITELYCMVIDTNNSDSSKPTTKPADPSNPKTGDQSMILASTAAMLISAGALAAYYVYDRKRRMA